MAGPASTYFEAKKAEHQPQAETLTAQAEALTEQAHTLTAKAQAANDALNILAKTTLTQDDGEQLIALYEKAN